MLDATDRKAFVKEDRVGYILEGTVPKLCPSSGTANLIPNQFHRYGSIPKAPVKRYHIIPHKREAFYLVLLIVCHLNP
jgi:hypothetical protein